MRQLLLDRTLAISATGKDLDSTIDPGFGKTTYFLIVDAKSGDIVEVIDNSAAQNAGGNFHYD